ncbi:hypothetical protein [Mycobacterium deserti]|uniref:Secreted protein n=1 Tax=Mycobacterium deserti TaxID=2978347 RepID=A0ABT2MHM7_9MYCO|nr:hypothetical protein [Mycobacterium deserti]MCT7660481.1 hypothetical protein [Mycobacterium deserti]
MVAELQFLATAAFLIWCLTCSVTGLFADDHVAGPRLVQREHRPPDECRRRVAADESPPQSASKSFPSRTIR